MTNIHEKKKKVNRKGKDINFIYIKKFKVFQENMY